MVRVEGLGFMGSRVEGFGFLVVRKAREAHRACGAREQDGKSAKSKACLFSHEHLAIAGCAREAPCRVSFLTLNPQGVLREVEP